MKDKTHKFHEADSFFVIGAITILLEEPTIRTLQAFCKLYRWLTFWELTVRLQPLTLLLPVRIMLAGNQWHHLSVK